MIPVTLRRAVKVLGGACALGLLLPVMTWAQAPAPAAPVIVAPTRSLALEWGITIIMVGLALFVVCRSSHRN